MFWNLCSDAIKTGISITSLILNLFILCKLTVKDEKLYSRIKAPAWKLAATQQTLICLLIPHTLMDRGIIWWTSCALSLSTVDLFLPRSHFAGIPPGSSMQAQFERPHLRQSGWPWHQKLKCFFFLCGFWNGTLILSHPPKKLCLPQYGKEKLLRDFTMASKKRLHDVSCQGMDEKLTFTSFFLSASLEL